MGLKAAVSQYFERNAQWNADRDNGVPPPENERNTADSQPDQSSSVSFNADLEGIPAKWIAGVRNLIKLPCPPGVLPKRWQTLQIDAAKFTERWGAQAARLGWTTADVFGINRVKPFERLDAAGLVRLLNGREVVALTATEAVITCPTGSRQTYRRKPPGVVPAVDRCLLWDLAGGDR